MAGGAERAVKRGEIFLKPKDFSPAFSLSRTIADFKLDSYTDRQMNTTKDWQIRCPQCNRSKNLAEIPGAVRIGAFSIGKRTLGYCSQCKRLRWLVIERVPTNDLPPKQTHEVY